MIKNVRAYVLLGGHSSRMGQPKHALPYGASTLLDHLVRSIRDCVCEIVLVTKPEHGVSALGCRVLHDQAPEACAVEGIRTALNDPGPEWKWILACDMPRISSQVLLRQKEIVGLANASGCCASKSPYKVLEPFPSLWHPRVRDQLHAGWGLRAQDWLRKAELAVWRLDAQEEELFENLNTPLEWQGFISQASNDREKA